MAAIVPILFGRITFFCISYPSFGAGLLDQLATSYDLRKILLWKESETRYVA